MSRNREAPGRALTAKSQSARPGAAGRRILCLGSAFQGVFKVAQPVAATLDVEDMCAAEQPMEDGLSQSSVRAAEKALHGHSSSITV